MYGPMELTPAFMRARLAAVPRTSAGNPTEGNVYHLPRRRAAVLIPFTRIEDQWHLLFIRRTRQEHDRHGGQVAFPGGGVEDGDEDIIATALREAHEETGVRPEDVEVLGRLNDVISISNFHVTPVIGIIPAPYPFIPQEEEVARIFTIPLEWLANPENHEIRQHRADNGKVWPVVYFREFDGELLWGFTAMLVNRLIDVLSGHG